MYSLDEVKALIKVLEDSKLSVLELSRENGDSIRLEKSVPAVAAAPAVVPVLQEPVSAPAVSAQPAAEDNTKIIKSPMVGVFYAAPSPDSKPFVTVGQQVNKGDVVCIIEAMKLMNEITAEQSGTVCEVCASDGDIIEYGQTLFRIK